MDALRGGDVVKRVAVTSRLAFKELLDVLQPRVDHPNFDVNSCRPRITSLRDKNLVVADGKRRCRVTGRLAWTWAPAGGDVDPQPAERKNAEVRQSVLDLGWSGGGP
jgi:hypothetical protein